MVVTGELAGKGVTCKVRRAGEAVQLFAQQVSSPLINTGAVAAERGRNILADRGEQAAIDLVLPCSPARCGRARLGGSCRWIWWKSWARPAPGMACAPRSGLRPGSVTRRS